MIKGVILSFPPVFDMLVFSFLFTVKYLCCNRYITEAVFSDVPDVDNSHSESRYSNKMMKAGGLRHYAASLLQLYYVCVGDH